METASWIDKVLEFARALKERADARGYEPFRPECRADVEYLRKAAELLELVTQQNILLSNQLDTLYRQDFELREAADEAIKIVKNQMNLHEP